MTLQNVDNKPGHELITIESRTGRIVVSGLKPAQDAVGRLPSRLMQYGIGSSSGSKNRVVAVGDLDGDGLTDVIATSRVKSEMGIDRATMGG